MKSRTALFGSGRFFCVIRAFDLNRDAAASRARLDTYVTFFWCRSSDFHEAGSGVWRLLFLPSLPVILAAPQQMVRWGCLRPGHVAASSACCPLRRPPPRHPVTNYFLFVTGTRVIRGTWHFRQPLLSGQFKTIPTRGTQFDLELVLKLFNWGHWEAMGDGDWIFGLQKCHVLNLRVGCQAFWGLCVCAPVVSCMTHTDPHINTALKKRSESTARASFKQMRHERESFKWPLILRSVLWPS